MQSVKGGAIWDMESTIIAKYCPSCGSEHVAGFKKNKWICSDCGSVSE